MTITNRSVSTPGSAQVGRLAGEGGFMVPLVALSMVALLLLATVALDGSQAYPQRRSAQNAADAAAVSATQALDKANWFDGSPSAIYEEALTVAHDNRAHRIECTLFRMRGRSEPVTAGDPTPDIIEMGSCNATTSTIPIDVDPVFGTPLRPQGVRIKAFVDRTTTFGAISGKSTVTATATASATVQKLKSTGSPFIVCANPARSLAPPPGTRGFDLLKTNPAVVPNWDVYSSPWDPPFVFNSDGTVDIDPVKAAAANAMNGGRGIPLVGAENSVPRCGVTSANFDGNGGFETVMVPSWIGFTSGGGYSASASEQVVSSNPCPDPFPPNYDANANPCDIVLPLAIDGNASDKKLRVVAIAVFRISGNGLGNPKYFGKVRGDIRYVSGGTTTIDPVTAASLRVVRLID